MGFNAILSEGGLSSIEQKTCALIIIYVSVETALLCASLYNLTRIDISPYGCQLPVSPTES